MSEPTYRLTPEQKRAALQRAQELRERLQQRHDDRLQRLMDDPEAYMAEARQRAREMVERDMRRDRAQRRAAFWRRLRFWAAR